MGEGTREACGQGEEGACTRTRAPGKRLFMNRARELAGPPLPQDCQLAIQHGDLWRRGGR